MSVCPGRWKPYSTRSQRSGAGWTSSCIRLLATGRAAWTGRRRVFGWLSDHHAGLMLDIPSNGPTGRALDEKGRYSLHYDVLWQPDGGKELQHHGSSESCS